MPQFFEAMANSSIIQGLRPHFPIGTSHIQIRRETSTAFSRMIAVETGTIGLTLMCLPTAAHSTMSDTTTQKQKSDLLPAP